MLDEKQLILEIAKEVREHNYGKNDWICVSSILGKKYGIVKTPNACKKAFQRAKKPFSFLKKEPSLEDVKRDWQESEGSYGSIEIRNDGTHISERKIAMSETDMKNPDFVLEAHGFDPSEFELVSVRNNFWSGHNKEDGEVINYQSKITVRPRKESTELTRKDIEEVVSEFKPKVGIKLAVRKFDKEYALEVDLADLHIGSLSWHGEVGEDYDYKIAREKIYKQIADIKAIIKLYDVSKLYLCFLGDYLHIDTEDSTTTKGTRVDTDSRPKKVVTKALEILLHIIDELSFIETELIWVEGNHSRLVEYALFQSLPFIYSNHEHIKFDVRPVIRKAFLYKGNLVGLHHGEMKKDQMFNWLQVEYRDLWAKASYVEQHSGHIHQEQVTEKGGIIQRTNPTSKGQDLYEFSNGWKSNKASIAYLWSEEGNLEAQFYLR